MDLNNHNKFKRLFTLIGIPAMAALFAIFVFLIIYAVFRSEEQDPPTIYLDPSKAGNGKALGKTPGTPGLTSPAAIPLNTPDNASISQGSAGRYAFTGLKKEFLPSTKGIPGQAVQSPDNSRAEPLAQIAEPDAILKVSGSLEKEMFIIGFYDDMNGAKLKASGALSMERQGKRTGGVVRVSFSLKTGGLERPVQLPVLLDGEVTAVPFNGTYEISGQGVLTATGTPDVPLKIDYTILRLDKNAAINSSYAVSHSLEREFKAIPPEIRALLDTSMLKKPGEQLSVISSVMNSCFGYQKDILPVQPAPDNTWGALLKQALGSNRRLAADCDVLAVYGLIFTRYMGLHSAVIVGYNNDFAGGLAELTPDEQHAALYVESDNGWEYFDPSDIVPDLTIQAAELAGVNLYNAKEYGKLEHYTVKLTPKTVAAAVLLAFIGIFKSVPAWFFFIFTA